jgi:hypothetical protein
MFQPYRYVQTKNRYYITPNRKTGYWLKLMYNAQLTESPISPEIKNLIRTNNYLHTFPEYKYNWTHIISIPKI